jgi:hypothetical protein
MPILQIVEASKVWNMWGTDYRPLCLFQNSTKRNLVPRVLLQRMDFKHVEDSANGVEELS